MKAWLGNLVSTVFSNGFKMFEEEKMNKKGIKAYCAENILYNIIELIRQNGLTSQHLQQMSEFMRDELINYLIEKYPKSEEKEFNIAFANKIKPVENLENNENDLVYRSRVVFDFQRNGNYNPSIMRFLNYVIALPDEQIGLAKEDSTLEKMSLEDLFHEEIGNFFRKIEERKEVDRMKDYGHQIFGIGDSNLET